MTFGRCSSNNSIQQRTNDNDNIIKTKRAPSGRLKRLHCRRCRIYYTYIHIYIDIYGCESIWIYFVKINLAHSYISNRVRCVSRILNQFVNLYSSIESQRACDLNGYSVLRCLQLENIALDDWYYVTKHREEKRKRDGLSNTMTKNFKRSI